MPEVEGTIASILSWSADRPLWQQDALRRLVVQGELSPTDKAELMGMVRQWVGLTVLGTVAEPRSLVASDFPSSGSCDAVLRLVSLKELTGVNALAEGQTLSFGPAGLTVVYGENGAGKTGYFRVLKHACQARVVEPILGDVRQAVTPRPTATFEVAGTGEEAPRSLNWDGGTQLPDLKQFSLFDSACGRQIVGTASDPVFLPVGLEAFSPFADFLDEVRSSLETEASTLRDSQHLTSCFSELRGDHEVGRLVGSFPNSVTEEAIERLAIFSEADADQLRSTESRLKELAASDPAAALASLESLQKRIAQERMRVEAFWEHFGVDALHDLASKWEALLVAQEARTLSLGLELQNEPLPGVGSDPWRELFKAAREYSTQQAYQGQDFPVTEPGALCVLCMQPLDDKAAARLRRFESFIQDSSERALTLAELEWGRAFSLLANARLDPTSLVLLEEIFRESPSLQSALVAGCDELRRCHALVVDAYRSGTCPGDISIQTNVLGELEAFELSLDERIRSLAARNPAAEATPLRAQAAALTARQNLGKHKPILVEYLKRKAAADHIAALSPWLTTRVVTEKQKALATDAIGGRYGDALRRELDALGVDRFKLAYKSSAAKGQILQQLHFPDAPKVAKPEQILSEGEHRVAALAAFMAEVSLRPVAAGIILDDPVSSLDHRWVQRVSRRLVEEAKSRQVIVFTHHLHFLYALRSAAEEPGARVAFHPRIVHWVGRSPGGVSEGLPWRGRGVSERIPILEKIVADARKIYDQDPEGEEYSAAKSRFTNLLRATWERLVEEALFQGVVTRFQDEIFTKKLREVVIESEDYEAVTRGMSWTSRQIDGHDHSIHVAEIELTPKDMAEAMAHLHAYRGRLKDRQAEAGRLRD